MNDPAQCDHDFRRIFPRHITRQHQTDPREAVLFVVCCRCGKSPIYFMHLGNDPLPTSPDVQGDWPQDLRISSYDFDRSVGPSVQFHREEDVET